jgi:hypothetical protein
LAAELEEIQGEPAPNLVWWANEIDRAVAELQRLAPEALRAEPATPATQAVGSAQPGVDSKQARGRSRS